MVVTTFTPADTDRGALDKASAWFALVDSVSQHQTLTPMSSAST